MRTMKSMALVGLICAAMGCGGGGKKQKTQPVGGGGEGGGGEMMKMETAEPGDVTKEVWGQIQGWDTWPKFAGHDTPMQSKGHMNMFVLAYHNDVAGKALAEKTLPLPDGSLIVKTNAMTADAAPMALTIMAKRDSKWFWAETTPDGKVVVMEGEKLEGEPKMCTNCHAQSDDTDFVVTQPK